MSAGNKKENMSKKLERERGRQESFTLREALRFFSRRDV